MENGHTEEDLRLYEVVKNLFETLYSKGRLEYDTSLHVNKEYFALRPDKRATHVDFYIKPDLDKISLISDKYDQEYVDILKSLEDINNIRKYIGKPNLVIGIEYDWDSTDKKHMDDIKEEFQKITDVIVNNIIRDYNIKISLEEFKERYDFGLYPMFWESDGEMIVEVFGNGKICKEIGLTKVWKHVLDELGKFGITIENTYNSLCGKDR